MTLCFLDTAPYVHGREGEDIRLPCEIQDEPLSVVWVKEDITDQQEWKTKATFFDRKAQRKDDRFHIDKNFSLVITDLKVADTGLYHCDVTLRNFESFSNSTLMMISCNLLYSHFNRPASVIGTEPNVRGWKGEDIRLRCDIQEEPLAVFWSKESDSDQQPPTVKAAFFGGNFESREERFDIDKNFSLVITTLEVADEGLYHCDVVLTNRDDFTNSTFLMVDSMASKHVIEECVAESQSNKSRCTYQTSSNTPSVNLTCVVSEFKPNISMLWSKETGEILNSTVAHQTTLSDDTYERFEAITVFVHDGTEETFICVATGDPLHGISTAEVTVLSPSAVGTAPNVRGWKGEDIRLRCDIQEEPLTVFWSKESESDQEPPTIKAAFFGGNFESRGERFDIDKNFSLVITTLEVADEGLYHCDVVLTNRDDFTNSTFLTVDSMASKHVIEECVNERQSNRSRCAFQTSSNNPSINLTCVVSEFKPNISMSWSKETGVILNSTVSQQTTLSDDTYERFEAITVFVHDGTEETFICVATGDPLNGISTAEVTVLSLSEKHGNSALVLGLAIGVPVALAILFLLGGIFLQRYHPEYLPRKGVEIDRPANQFNKIEDVAGIPAGDKPEHIHLTGKDW
ncbi:uncharacterized protein [Diadema setosum]|uniref:uncharacterized protein n=1 Tax=Diadema setosum TaxID=31175 RepID=UPI003B3A5DEC